MSIRRVPAGRLSGDGKLIDGGSQVAEVHYDIQFEREIVEATTHQGRVSAPGFLVSKRAILRIKSGRIDSWNHRSPYTLLLCDGRKVEVNIIPEVYHQAQILRFTLAGNIEAA